MKLLPHYCPHCGAANEATQVNCAVCSRSLKQDTAEDPFLLNQRYRILKLLGTGGFSAVYQVQDTRNAHAILAVKQINLAGLSPQQIIEATEVFHREVRLLAPLEHPNLPHIHDHFTDPQHWYIVMDFIKGETLEEYLAAKSTGTARSDAPLLPLQEVIAIGVQLCTVLDYLHTRQPPIIFRDLKPSNIMRTTTGHLYLIDFGIARHFKPGQEKDTIPLGSPGYAAPEQYGKAQTTTRSDIYSLGVLLHQLLSGDDPSETPFHFAPLRLYGGEGVTELIALIERMVHLSVEQRPENVREVKETLECLQSLQQNRHTTIFSTPLSPNIPPQQKTGTMGPQGQQQMMRPPLNSSRRSFTRNIGLGAAALIGTGVIGYGIYEGFISSSKPSQKVRPPIPTTKAGNASSVTWSSDAQNIAFVRSNGDVEIKNVSQQVNPRFYQGKGSLLAWSPDSAYIASNVSDTEVQIWDARSTDGGIIHTYKVYDENTEYIMSLSWSPDSKRILVGGYNSCRVLEIATGTINTVGEDALSVNPVYPPTLIWSPNSIDIAMSIPGPKNAPNIVQICNIGKARQGYRKYKGTQGTVRIMAWSPNGKYIILSDENPQRTYGTIRLWEVAATLVDTSLFFSSPHVDCFAWKHDSTLVAFNANTLQIAKTAEANDPFNPVYDLPSASSSVSSGPPLTMTWTQDDKNILLADGNGNINVQPYVKK